MQVEPATAQEVGPALLGREVDITDAYDNADGQHGGAQAEPRRLPGSGDGASGLLPGPRELAGERHVPGHAAIRQRILDMAARMNA